MHSQRITIDYKRKNKENIVYFQINHSIISNTFLIFEIPYIVQKVRKVNAMYFYRTLSFKVVIYAQF